VKIVILTHLETEASHEHDPVVDQVARALRKNRHKTSILGVHGDLKKLINGLSRRKPDLVFNLMETFGSTQMGAVGLVGLLDLLQLRYTGGGPGEYYLQEDKALTKKLLAFHKIGYPDFAVFTQSASLETGGSLRMPLIVKPLRMDASIGIDGNSLVRSTSEMMERVLSIHKDVNDAALVEEYVDGREFYVGVLGNESPVAFPPIEMDFSRLEEGLPRILDGASKWDENSPQYKGTEAILADIPTELRARLQQAALEAYRALRVRDYGRIDMRLTEAGEIYVIEVNASCYLEQSGEFAVSAAAAGIEYPALIERIVKEAMQRYETPGNITAPKRQRPRGKPSRKAAV
jgi:D-alanine-D-alanine ligase